MTLEKAFWAKAGKFREDPMEADPNAGKEKELANTGQLWGLGGQGYQCGQALDTQPASLEHGAHSVRS